MKAIIFVLLNTLLGTHLLSQSSNIGTPLIQNFAPHDYHAGTQSWDLEIAEDGTLLVANNNGLLCFDGEKWKSFTQPNSTIGRSLSSVAADKIYFGGQDEIGFFEKDNHGKLIYNTLLSVIPEEVQNLEDVWQIKSHDSFLVFRSNDKISVINNDQYQPIEDGITSNFLSKIEDTFYYNNFEKGIYTLNIKGEKKFLEGSEFFIKKAVIDILKIDEATLLILTEEDGLYLYKNKTFQKWETNANDFFAKKKVISGVVLKDETIAIGTRLGGLVLLKKDGRATYKIDKKAGLQNNSITSIAEDAWGNLWLGTYYGIDKVNLAASLNSFYPDGDLEGAVYDIKLWQNKWWFGTVNGLYSLPYQEYYNPFEPHLFEFIENTGGQVWSLDIVDDQLYLGHNSGAFKVIADGSIERMGDFIGTWKFIGLTPNKMAIGTYDGVLLFKKEAEKWVFDYRIAGFRESSRIMIKHGDRNLWISHPYRGIFKINFDEDFEKYTIKKYTPETGFVQENKNYIFSIFDTPYVTNDSGIYRYEIENDTFLRDSLLNNLLSGIGRVQKIINKDDSIWYISEKETGIIKIRNNGLTNQYDITRFAALSDLYVAGFENLFPKNANSQMLCTNTGVRYHHPTSNKSKHPLQASVANVKLTNSDSLIFLSATNKQINLSAKENAIEFNFRTNGKTNQELKGYSYMLKGLETEWHAYSNKSFKEYTNLDHGTYQFLLKAQDNNGNESAIAETIIEISPPWYLTTVALFFYGLLVIAGILALLLIPQRKYKETTAILVNKQKETEEEMERIKQEKLENELTFKNQELASSALHLLQKNQTLNSLRDKISDLRKNIKDAELRKELNNIVSILRSDLRLDEDWDRFSIHFDQVHDNFTKRLKANYPKLSTKDFKLCTYLKMNLSTKEIAPLLGISVRGVEISRYRLRKKLSLEKSVDLNDFMNSI